MNTKLFTFDLSTLPNWSFIVIAIVVILIIIVVLFLVISGKSDVKFGSVEIKNSGRNISKKPTPEMNKLNGSWSVIAMDIQIANHPFNLKYRYEAELNIQIEKFKIMLSGHLTYRDYNTNEKISDTEVAGYGYLADGQGSISYETIASLHNHRLTTGLGVIYVHFNLNSKDANGYFLTSNESEYKVGIGTVNMKKNLM